METPKVVEKEPKDTKVLVAMSGGVDSSVTAALLKSQGFQMVGVHMQLWDHGDANKLKFGSRCCSTIDANDARRVCDKIDIPYYVINAEDVFEERVVDYFVHEYLKSRTPNPCVECNNAIKFSYLFDKADELGCDFVATGHYAQVHREPITGKARLLKAVDAQKDQSYFLYGLSQESLRRTMMPLGGLTKMMVRKLAVNFDLLGVSDKPDSQEICFIADEGYKEFIRRRTQEEIRPPGLIRAVDGTVVGEHKGMYHYTVGQRKGLSIKNEDRKNPFYVIGFDTVESEIIVGSEKFLMHDEVIVDGVNWISPIEALKGISCKARIRSQHKEADCKVFPFENKTVRVTFADKQRAITPGQSIVFYREDEVLGGGLIQKVRGSFANRGPAPKPEGAYNPLNEEPLEEADGW